MTDTLTQRVAEAIFHGMGFFSTWNNAGPGVKQQCNAAAQAALEASGAQHIPALVKALQVIKKLPAYGFDGGLLYRVKEVDEVIDKALAALPPEMLKDKS